MKTELIRARLTFILVIVLSLTLRGYSQENPSQSTGPAEVAEGVYFVGDFGCNIAASIGPDGVLLIDSGLKNRTDQVLSALKQVTNAPVRIVMNTHYHFDHVGGNEALAREGAVIISQEQARARMTLLWEVKLPGYQMPTVQPYPAAALAKVTYAETIKVYLNGEEIEALHLPAGHSDGDAVIRFKKANFIHTGDLFLSNGFTLIDLDSGCTIDGYLAAVDKIIGLCDDKTVVMPGHGPISNRKGLQSFRNMLAVTKDRVAGLIKEGKTLEEVIAADVTAGLFRGGKSWLDPNLFVYFVYTDLSKKQKGSLM